MANTPNIEDEQEVIAQYSEVCAFCMHLQGFRKCQAFDEIPLSIWTGKNDHTKPVKGDNGLRFKKYETTPRRS